MGFKKSAQTVSNFHTSKSRKIHLKNLFLAEDSCKVFCNSLTGSKSRSWTFPDGTTCKNENSDIDDSYHCVNGKCEVKKKILQKKIQLILKNAPFKNL